jgi:hypothetical protein
VEVHREAQFPSILMSYHAPNWEEQDAYALELLDKILSQGRSSRLYNSLIYKQKLALEVGSDFNLDTKDPFLFMVYGQPMPGKTVAQVEAALNAEIKKMQTDLVSDAEMLKAKNQTTASFYMALDSIFYWHAAGPHRKCTGGPLKEFTSKFWWWPPPTSGGRPKNTWCPQPHGGHPGAVKTGNPRWSTTSPMGKSDKFLFAGRARHRETGMHLGLKKVFTE